MDDYWDKYWDNEKTEIHADMDGYVEHSYKKMIRETSKAWLLDIRGWGEKWFSKIYCTLDEEEQVIIVPNWLNEKIKEEIMFPKEKIPKEEIKPKGVFE